MPIVPGPFPLLPGDPERVAGWRIIGRLGSGGMGVVYFAERESDNSRGALKMTHPGLAGDAAFRARFRREVATSRTVMGRYVAAVLDADADADLPWLATEYVEGPTLGSVIDEDGALVPEQAVALAAGLLEGLAQIHAAGVIHRDLKPSNILLTQDAPIIIDFGVAIAGDATSLTATGTSVGSAGWMAPEQVIGNAAGTPADIFAWGAVVAYAATGRPPFGSGRPDALAYRVAHGDPDVAEVPGVLGSLVRRAMAKDPALRPTLDQLRSGLTGGHPDDTAAVAAAWASPTRVHARAAPGGNTLERQEKTGPVTPAPRLSRRPALALREVAFATALVTIIAVAVGLIFAAQNRGRAVTAADSSTTTSTGSTSTVPTSTSTPSTTATTTITSTAPTATTATASTVAAPPPPTAPGRPQAAAAPWAEPPVPAATEHDFIRDALFEDDRFNGPYGCQLLAPTGTGSQSLSPEYAQYTRLGDFQFGWSDAAAGSYNLAVYAPGNQGVDHYFDADPEGEVYADGSVLRSDSQDADAFLITLPGQPCFYELSLFDVSMVGRSNFFDSLRRLNL